MVRDCRILLCGFALVAATATSSQAQIGFGGYGGGYGGYGGFGGWGYGGTSALGDIDRGEGQLAAGIGAFDVEAAQAGSINTDTVMRWNQYLYASRVEAQKRYNASKTRRLNLDKAHYEAHQAQIRDKPSEVDIDSGDALNAILDQLTDPKLMKGSSMRLANGTLSAQSVKDIPFRDETDAITLSLDKLTDDKSWPLPLRSDNFKAEREAYTKSIDDAMEEDKDDGSLKPETIKKVRDAVSRLYQKVADTIPKTQQPDHLQAMNYLKGLAGLSKMLEKPNVEGVIAELEKVKNTSVGNLISFMHAYNLRFAPAETPKSRAVYRDLYPMMAEAREKIAGKPGDGNADATPPAPADDNPTALFHGMDESQLHGKPGDPKPK